MTLERAVQPRITQISADRLASYADTGGEQGGGDYGMEPPSLIFDDWVKLCAFDLE